MHILIYTEFHTKRLQQKYFEYTLNCKLFTQHLKQTDMLRNAVPISRMVTCTAYVHNLAAGVAYHANPHVHPTSARQTAARPAHLVPLDTDAVFAFTHFYCAALYTAKRATTCRPHTERNYECIWHVRRTSRRTSGHYYTGKRDGSISGEAPVSTYSA